MRTLSIVLPSNITRPETARTELDCNSDEIVVELNDNKKIETKITPDKYLKWGMVPKNSFFVLLSIHKNRKENLRQKNRHRIRCLFWICLLNKQIT